MKLSDATVHVLDFEGSAASGVVEYGLATLEGGKVVSTATRLCRPRGGLDPRDVKVHGVREVEAAAEAPFAEERERVVRLRRTGLFCAHSAGVEARFLAAEWSRPPLVPCFDGSGREAPEWGPWLDTCALYRRLFPQLESHALQALVTTFQLQAELDVLAKEHCPPKRRRWHAALYDALASAALLRHLLRLDGFASVTLPWLLRHSTAEAYPAQGELF